jgi:hypothetical protein
MKVILVFIAMLLHFTSFSQTDESSYIENPIIRFKEGTAVLSKEERSNIDNFFSYYFSVMKNNDTLYFFKKADFILQSFTTPIEHKKNNLIGMKRCVVILDYIENKYHINRSNFHIVDVPPNGDSNVIFFFTRK